MLSELTGLQESEEDVWTCAEVSFTIQTRADEDAEVVERDYTFSYTPEWDKWTFVEFEERCTENTKYVKDRNWRRSRHIMWGEEEQASVSVPPEVEQKLQEMLGLEEMTLQI